MQMQPQSGLTTKNHKPLPLYTISSNQHALHHALFHASTNTTLDSRYSLTPLSPQKVLGQQPTATAAAFQQPLHPAAAVVDGTQPLQIATLAEPPSNAQTQEHYLEMLQQLRAASRSLFLILWHSDATEDAMLRWSAFKAGANMVTHCPHAVAAALQQVAAQQQHYPQQHGQQQQQQQPTQQREAGDNTVVSSSSSSSGARTAGSGEAGSSNANSGSSSIVCDWCGLPGLSPAEYWNHQPLYHIHDTNLKGVCQICGSVTSNIARHLHDHHKPSGAGPEQRTGVFALCIIRRPSDGRFLMTQEFAGAGFWIPGGGVDAGESLSQAAVRECWEEAGVQVELKGILALESHHAGEWRRVIFWGVPAALEQQQQDSVDGPGGATSSTPQQQPQQQQQQQKRVPALLEPCCCPKSLPDFESAGAAWVSVDELHQLPLRSESECRWIPAVASGKAEATCPLYHSLQLPAEWEAVFQGFPVV